MQREDIDAMKQQYPANGEPKTLGTIDLLLDILSRLRLKAGNHGPDMGGKSGEASQSDDLKPKVTLGALIEELDERAYGMLLLVLALPCCLPFVYILPQIVALPMLAICAQLGAGRVSPWLPKKLSGREFNVDDFEGVIKRGAKYIGWFERLARPRLTALTQGMGSRIIGVLLLIPCASILVPLPSTNTVPGISIAIASIGLIERDGLLVLLGLLGGLAWVLLLAFLGFEASQIIKDFVLNRG